MGFFSWLTNDSKESIANYHSSRPTFTVYLLDNKGNCWKETEYNGYGDFGGKDFFELLAEMNGEEGREKGIDLFYEPDKDDVLYPNLVIDVDNWNWVNEKPERCPWQGYFYD